MNSEYAKYQIDIAGYFKLLSNPARIKIIEMLHEKDNISTSELAYNLPLGRTTVFQHIKVLKEAGWIVSTSSGYSLNKEVVKKNSLNLNRYIKNLYSIVSMKTTNLGVERLNKILFLCTQNSCRSQMAEAFFNYYKGSRSIKAYSAGTSPSEEIHPYAIEVMREKGISLLNMHPKSTEEFKGDNSIDFVAFVCTMAEKDCPYLFPYSKQKMSIPFDDPAAFRGNREDKLLEFRRVRDLIEERVIKLLEEIPE